MSKESICRLAKCRSNRAVGFFFHEMSVRANPRKCHDGVMNRENNPQMGRFD